MIDRIVASPPDDRDYIFDVKPGIYLPARVSLRQWALPIEDQQQEGSCGAHTGATICESKLLARGQFRHLSRQQLYYDARALTSRVGLEGVVLRDVFKALRNTGVANELSWSYLPGNENTQPTPDVIAEAATQKLGRFERLPLGEKGTIAGLKTTRDNIKSALLQGYKVAVAFNVQKWIFDLQGDPYQHAMLNTARTDYLAGDGGHAWIIDTADDGINGGSYGCQSSWTPAWGDRGYGYLSYAWGESIFEAWIAKNFIVQDSFPTAPAALTGYSPEQVLVAMFYAAMFGRAPDASGLTFWAGKLAASSPADVAQEMYRDAPARAYFPDFFTNAQIAQALYTNTLGRQPDLDGLAYWSGLLDQGDAGDDPRCQGNVIAALVMMTYSYSGPDPVAQNACWLLHNRAEVGLYCAVDRAFNSVGIAEQALTGVTSDPTSVVSAKAWLNIIGGAK